MKDKYNVLIAEDEPLMCEYLKNNLSKIHDSFEASCAVRNGESALKELEKNEYDLLIADIKMPLMDGITLITKLRGEGNNIPVIILSGYDEFEFAKAGISLGVIDYLLKPLNDNELYKTLDKLKNQLLENEDKVTLPKDWSPESIKTFISSCFCDFDKEKSSLVDKATAYILEHFNEPIGQIDVAKTLGVTPAYLSSIFHKTKGESYSKFLTRFRMTQAAMLLKSNNTLTIQKVAKMVGFETDKYFIKVFKGFFGVTPDIYRKS